MLPDVWIKPLAEKVGIDGPTMLYVLGMFTVYPLAAFYHFLFVEWLPRGKYLNLQRAYIITCSLLLLACIFPLKAVLDILVPILGTWFALKFGQGWKWTPLCIFLGTMVHLAYHEYLVQVLTNADLEATAGSDGHVSIMMLIVIRLTSFAFDVCDGKLLDITVSESVKRVHGQTSIDALAENTRCGLDSVSFWDFLAYCLLFTGVLNGPAVSYGYYRAWLEYAPPKGTPGRLIYSLGNRVPLALFCMAFHVVASKHFPIRYLVTREFFRTKALWWQLAYSWLAFLGIRTKYYFVWLMGEGANVLAGMGLRINKSASTGHSWDGIINIKIWQIELSADPRTIVNGWHTGVALWLRKYVFERSKGPLGSATLASMLTFAVSALWHGFYPGYYVMMGQMAVLIYGCRLCYRNFSFPPWMHAYQKRMLLYPLVQTLLIYNCYPFAVRSWNLIEPFYRQMGWSLHWLQLIVIVGIRLLYGRGTLAGSKREIAAEQPPRSPQVVMEEMFRNDDPNATPQPTVEIVFPSVRTSARHAALHNHPAKLVTPVRRKSH